MVTAKRLKKIADWNARRIAKKEYKQSIKRTLKQLKDAAKYGKKFWVIIDPLPNEERLVEFLQKRGFECEKIYKYIDAPGANRDITMLKIKWE